MKRILKDYFTFSKKERVAVIILLLLIGVFIAAPYFYSAKHKPPLVNKELQHFMAQQKNVKERPDSLHTNTGYVKTFPPEKQIDRKLFYFDPNTITAEGWKQLGIADKTIRTIINYRNKGGKFKTAEDIRKIWGMKKEDAEQLIPYVQLAETVIPFPKKSIQTLTPQIVNKKQPLILDINTATFEEWESLPGIGAVLANRIIKFREKMGGFKNVEQIRKTYGISDSVFMLIAPYLHLQTVAVAITYDNKLDLNKTNAHDLAIKVGIPEAIARSIVVYREQYGPFKSVDELKKIVFINDTLFHRIEANLSIK